MAAARHTTREGIQVQRAGIDRDPVHGDIRVGELAHPGREAGSALPRDSHHDMGGAGAVYQFLQSVDRPEDGDGIGLGMEAPDDGSAGRRLEARECPESTKPTIGRPLQGLAPRRRSNRRASRRAPTSTTRLGVVPRSVAVPTRPAISSVLSMNRHPSLGFGLLVAVTPRPVGGSTLTSRSSYRTSASVRLRLVFRSSPTIDRTDVKFELFRRDQ